MTDTATDTADSASAPGPDRSAPADEVALPDNRYANREMSWLDFNARVLALAEDRRQPLLERMKFLSIFASNLDEFYMVRVAGLKRRQEMGLAVRSSDGLSPRERLALVADRSKELSVRHARCFLTDIEPALAAEGIKIIRWRDLTTAQQKELSEYFHAKIFPVLTPLAVDPAHPFPYISGLSLNLAVLVRDPGSDVDRFARIKVPNNVRRFVVVTQSVDLSQYLPIEDLIAAHLSALFPGMEVVEHHLFRVTRNTDFEVDEDRDEDLLQALERELVRRRFGPPVRLEVGEDIDSAVLALLVSEIDVQPEDVLQLPGLLDLTALWQVYDVDRPALKERPFVPATHPRFAEGETPKSVFATLREGDVLVHHPYESFATSVQRFIEQAAADPNVLAIKQTLYRTSGDSPIVDALVDAAEAGKQVVVLVEIKARFDEQANIKWARALERAGCHVVYGLVGLKTHCKTSLVVRQEGGSLRRYAHIGTGNYHPKTARLYEDFGLFTADERICSDLTDLFNVLTGYSRQTDYRTLLVAPHRLRSGLLERVEREIIHAKQGRPAHIQIKTNHLVDEALIDALYRASAAGVNVQLMVRTFCTIKAQVPGLSDNISVRSILGRFLEHSRVFYFANDGDPEYWIGSADMMHRNLDRRVEVLAQVTGPNTDQLRETLDMAFAPDTASWELQGDGRWIRAGGSKAVDYQEVLLSQLASRSE
ncbi:RNA degradosome polyphosphate kinase [Jatrophihabitans telluris]|uniref:Polyphosphate kinase n=1 Tax=Jatrophihabitans telluris TaxID=2038343 RepID=A0ABY4R4J8_9ACTN|nr:RNA degradosome polyphosphate kinase [Jatrophihabitans telluris]UQX89956.1 RNA degradosome polyphosphate kinase [Jatrophihabitans telluris]